MPARFDDATRQVAFEQFARNFLRALGMTPLGWAVVGAMAWAYAPRAALIAWGASAAAFWILSFVLVKRRSSFSSDLQRQESIAYSAAYADGLGWGSMAIFLMGIEPVLDAQLAAVLCGVVAVTLGIYITAVRAFALQLAGTWTAILLALMLDAGPGWPILLGLAAMHALTLYLLPPIVFRVVDSIRLQRTNAELVERLRVTLEIVEEEASTDSLTGALNRRAFDRLLAREWVRCEGERAPLSLLAMDLDHFKRVNDEHGHAVGDRVLQAFVEQSRSVLRQGDLLARLGGEEFVVVLPRASVAKASEVAERIRVAVSVAPLLAHPEVRVTVSIGIAAGSPGESGEAIHCRADAAAYEAKRSGRDCVRVSPTGPSAE